MQDIKLMKEKNGPASRAISMAMRIRWYGAEHIAQYGRSRATLVPRDAAIRQLFAPYCTGGGHGHRFRRKKSSCGIVEITF